jgi:uncharacterized protein (DUF2237 family)
MVSAADGYQNVFGSSLSACSSEGMALTGYTRTGYCVDQNDDAGSHHICIDLSSTNGGNFCTVTGQDDWCSSEMPCHENQNDVCQVEHWCVCQWAFASYIQNAGGCDAIQEVVCDAINIEALIAYQKQAKRKYQNALDCLVERCGINPSSLKVKSYLYSSGSSKWFVGGALIILSLVGTALWRRQNVSYNSADSKEVLLNHQTSDSKLC